MDTSTSTTVLPPSVAPPSTPWPFPTVLVVHLAMGAALILSFSFQACYNMMKTWRYHRRFWNLEEQDTDDFDNIQIDRATAEIQHLHAPGWGNLAVSTKRFPRTPPS